MKPSLAAAAWLTALSIAVLALGPGSSRVAPTPQEWTNEDLPPLPRRGGRGRDGRGRAAGRAGGRRCCWFPVTFTRWLPGWTVDVAVIIHGIEALLALSFIFVVHFFNAHLRSGNPLDPVFLTGRITLEELKDERPREYEVLVREGELDDELVEPSTPPLRCTTPGWWAIRCRASACCWPSPWR